MGETVPPTTPSVVKYVSLFPSRNQAPAEQDIYHRPGMGHCELKTPDFLIYWLNYCKRIWIIVFSMLMLFAGFSLVKKVT